MRVVIDERVRQAGTIALLVAAVLLLPMKADPVSPIGYRMAWAGGERGGLGDQVKGSYGYTNYLATEDPPVTPCQSCYGGSGTDAQDLSTYAYGQTAICESCLNSGRSR
jgi:hypothetical protein